MHYKLLPHLWYTISSTADCDVDCSNGISIHLPANFQHFLFADMESIDVSGEATVTQNPPSFTPYSESRGEEWTADLRIGHAAADAVAAVCTLTLGDLAKGGTLTDSNGQSVELENPHKHAEGWVALQDATAAGTIAFGEHEAIEFEAQPAVAASALLTMKDSIPEGIEFALAIGGEDLNSFSADNSEGWTLDSLVSAINNADNWPHAPEVEASEADGKCLLTAKSEYPGSAGNSLEVLALAYSPFTNPDTHLSGGVDARTPQEVVDALNASEDCPAVATLDADEAGISFTAKEYGMNDAIVVTGSLFSDEDGMSGGHGDYTVAELVTDISGEFSDITPAAGETEGTITLTATTAGKAANAITYTATGCFGSGITRQGSTTHGKDAVGQTDYKIYLNGEEFSGGGAPAAPVPEPLGTTTTLLHGHVYTLAVSADTDLSALGVELYGTAELWIDYTAGSVTWTTGLWWAEGSAPTLTAGKSYAIALRNDGVKLRANVQYEDDTPAQS